MDYRGNDIGQAKWVENQEACAKLSASNERALYWTFMPPTDHPWSNLCWIKTSNAGRMAMSTVVSGNRECGIECKCYNWMPWNVATHAPSYDTFTFAPTLSGHILSELFVTTDGNAKTKAFTDCGVEANTKYSGHNLYTRKGIKVGNMAGCANLCFKDNKCKFWTFNPR